MGGETACDARPMTIFLMLRTNMSSGHFGKSGRFAALGRCCTIQAFALKAVGLAGTNV